MDPNRWGQVANTLKNRDNFQNLAERWQQKADNRKMFYFSLR